MLLFEFSGMPWTRITTSNAYQQDVRLHRQQREGMTAEDKAILMARKRAQHKEKAQRREKKRRQRATQEALPYDISGFKPYEPSVHQCQLTNSTFNEDDVRSQLDFTDDEDDQKSNKI